MDYQRSDRVGDRILELVSELVRREIRDPRISASTITAVQVSKDLRHARVYFDLLGRPEDREIASAGFKSATGFIRSKIAKQLGLRFVPTIEFVYDPTEDEAKRINDLLRTVKS